MSTAVLTIDPLYQDWDQPFERAILDAEREIGTIYPRKEDRDAFLHAVWRHFQRVPKLQGCSPESIRAALIDLALSGLDITQRGEVWLVPFENTKKDPVTGKTQYKNNQPVKELECTVQDGYLGRIKLARQHPEIQDAWGRAVRDKDEYQYQGYHALPLHQPPAHVWPPRQGDWRLCLRHLHEWPGQMSGNGPGRGPPAPESILAGGPK